MSLPRYPEYKASGVEWLGEVPGHWGTARLRWLSTRYSGGTPDKLNLDYWTEGSIPWVNSGAVNQSLVTEPSAYITEAAFKNSSAKWIPTGALVMALAGQGKTKGMVAQLAIPTTCNQSMAAIIPNQELAARFLFWWLNSNYQNIRNMAGGDLRDGLNLELLGNIACPLAPFLEQQTIAAFLDRETKKIDALIAEQQRLVELLAEKRQAVISHAVTKGLNPNVKMKDSGIEWLGEVPVHWEVKRLRFVAELNPSKSEVATLDKEMLVSFLPMDAIGDDGRLNLEREKPIAEVETGYTFFRDGDVTVAKITPCFENGKGAVMRGLTQGIGFGTTELIVARPIASQVSSNYLHSLFTSVVFRKNGEGHMYGAGGQKRVPDDFVRNFEIAFPPLKEQQTIDAFLGSETAKFDTLTAEANRAIALLQEHRSTLISAAVTGKIDVRRHTGADRYPVDERIPA